MFTDNINATGSASDELGVDAVLALEGLHEVLVSLGIGLTTPAEFTE